MTATIQQRAKRVRPALPADLTASLRAAGVASFVDKAGQTWEWSSFKTRYVRTAAGARRYGLPIGSPIVAKGRKPNSSGKSEGGTAPAAPARPKAPSGDGNQVRPTPAQKAAAERHFGSEPGNERGAHVDGNRVVVEDRDKAVAALDRVLADPDLTPGERKSRKNLRDKIAATAQQSPDQPAPDAPSRQGRDRTGGETKPVRPATPAGVRDAYWDLASQRAEPIRLSELRKRMGGTRAEQDRALNDMSLDDDVLIREEANQQLLTDADRDAAVRLGGLDRHNIQIDAEPPAR